jgi:hypothetical protein
VVLTSALGKEVVKEEASVNVTLFIRDGEREEAAPASHIGVRTSAACRSDADAARAEREWLPCPCATDWWVRDRFQTIPVGVAHWATLFTGFGPLTNALLFFQIEPNL